jgi:hypothetical protein
VTFGGTQATVTSITSTVIIVIVPAGSAGSVPVAVLNGSQGSNFITFTYVVATATTTPVLTLTPTASPTITLTPVIPFTPTATVSGNDVFYVSKNAFLPSQGPVSIRVDYNRFPGNYGLKIYNSAGELIKDLSPNLTQLNAPIGQSYFWDGTNLYGTKCASGVYIFYLIEPFDRRLKRVILIQ